MKTLKQLQDEYVARVTATQNDPAASDWAKNWQKVNENGDVVRDWKSGTTVKVVYGVGQSGFRRSGDKLHLIIAEIVLTPGTDANGKPTRLRPGDVLAARSPCNGNGQHKGSLILGLDTDRITCQKCLERVDPKPEIEAHGVKGLKSTPWRKIFKDEAALNRWVEKNGATVHATTTVEEAK
jgi:hypothetical protein